ncbi:MAG TPA: metallophosphoesterase [Trueperaceae bacterium]|nr:metallophosphoesterase [Trueperaceae bacterium]
MQKTGYHSYRIMRYLILSDIHANYLALEAVLKHASSKRWESLISLGDLVGYNTHPEVIINSIKDLNPKVCLLGNHEELVFLAEENKLDDIKSSSIATQVARRHYEQISADNLAYLKTFKTSHIEKDSFWQTTHASIRRKWEYIDSLKIAQENAPLMEKNLLLIGHTHIPKVYISINTARGDIWRTMSLKAHKNIYRVPPNAKVIFNPGSVGQPRDGIPLASYAILDEEKRLIEHYRVEYDLMAQQRLIYEMDYPEQLARRLSNGR